VKRHNGTTTGRLPPAPGPRQQDACVEKPVHLARRRPRREPPFSSSARLFRLRRRLERKSRRNRQEDPPAFDIFNEVTGKGTGPRDHRVAALLATPTTRGRAIMGGSIDTALPPQEEIRRLQFQGHTAKHVANTRHSPDSRPDDVMLRAEIGIGHASRIAQPRTSADMANLYRAAGHPLNVESIPRCTLRQPLRNRRRPYHKRGQPLAQAGRAMWILSTHHRAAPTPISRFTRVWRPR